MDFFFSSSHSFSMWGYFDPKHL